MRRLTLKRETLAELGSDELALVAGASLPTGPITVVQLVHDLASYLVSCASVVDACPSSPCTR